MMKTKICTCVWHDKHVMIRERNTKKGKFLVCGCWWLLKWLNLVECLWEKRNLPCSDERFFDVLLLFTLISYLNDASSVPEILVCAFVFGDILRGACSWCWWVGDFCALRTKFTFMHSWSFSNEDLRLFIWIYKNWTVHLKIFEVMSKLFFLKCRNSLVYSLHFFATFHLLIFTLFFISTNARNKITTININFHAIKQNNLKRNWICHK